MHGGGRLWVALGFSIALVLQVPAGSLLDVGRAAGPPAIGLFGQAPPAPTHDPSSLAAPLHELAQTQREHQLVDEGYRAGTAWAKATMDRAGPHELGDALAGLYDARKIDPDPAAFDVGAVPAPFQAPLAVLVEAQANAAARDGPYAALPGPALASSGPPVDRSGPTSLAAQAFTLGVVEAVLPALEEAAQAHAPNEPIFVDPLGLVVLGGSGDDVYEPRTLAGTQWSGAVLVVEPGGNDTYEVPVAAATDIDREPGEPSPVIEMQTISMGLELEGSDRYLNRTAAAERGATTQAILIDRDGDDRYSGPSIDGTVASAVSGSAYLLDERGNDTYLAERKGIAYGNHGRAVLWDRAGEDLYRASPKEGELTFAVAENFRAGALLRDEQGADVYEAGLFAFGMSEGDSVARFVDREGADLYSVWAPDLSFGWHFRGPAAVDESPVNRGVAIFVDGAGQDLYQWEQIVNDPPLPANNHTRYTSGEDRNWSAFVDCTTPDGDPVPCGSQQRSIVKGILNSTRSP